jgi:hypothetical protein
LSVEHVEEGEERVIEHREGEPGEGVMESMKKAFLLRGEDATCGAEGGLRSLERHG